MCVIEWKVIIDYSSVLAFYRNAIVITGVIMF